MITKPEEAVHRYVGGLVTRGSEWFTASECAEIARAYGECVRVDFMCGRNAELYAWQEKFKAWEKAT